MLLLPAARWGDVKPEGPVELIRGHDLTFGLVGAWLLNEGTSQTIRDLTGNNHVTFTSPDIVSVRTARGRALDFSGASGGGPRVALGSWGPDNPMSLIGNQATFLFEARLDLGALTNNAPRLLDKSNGANGGNAGRSTSPPASRPGCSTSTASSPRSAARATCTAGSGAASGSMPGAWGSTSTPATTA
jgi:hypothetical protein